MLSLSDTSKQPNRKDAMIKNDDIDPLIIYIVVHFAC